MTGQSTSRGGEKNPRPCHLIQLTCGSIALTELLFLLQQGFTVPLESDMTLQRLLQRLGYTDGYIAERIQTVFINGRPVDDFETTGISPGDSLGLSGAMPGLVGAVMRAGSYLAPFRENIKKTDGGGSKGKAEESLSLKLFNLVLRESGPHFLAAGVLISSRDLKSFFASRESDFFRDCTSLVIDNEKTQPAPGALDKISDDGRPVYFTATLRKEA